MLQLFMSLLFCIFKTISYMCSLACSRDPVNIYCMNESMTQWSHTKMCFLLSPSRNANWWPVGKIWPANMFYLAQRYWPMHENWEIFTCNAGPTLHIGNINRKWVAVTTFIRGSSASICLNDRTELRTILQMSKYRKLARLALLPTILLLKELQYKQSCPTGLKHI